MPQWDNNSLKHFFIMLPVMGIIFGLLWSLFFLGLNQLDSLSGNLRGIIMTLMTLALTGGLHMDGLCDTFDAVFSHRDRATRLKILSDTHTGSFAVIGCVSVMLLKSGLFGEILTNHVTGIYYVPVYSRLGMSILLNNLPFAKSDGLAVILGASRNSRDNVFLALSAVILFIISSGTVSIMFVMSLAFWAVICVRIFGGITGDLLGAFVEVSEVIMLAGMVIVKCI